ncbi:HET-domain-containing protein [Pholiota conissans]|uniref:HET-domain-containing protein n=1 Tax=Pholiota conissans TaxID=109636 RepID=A0A9P6D5G0_9AGAR|nr:HET-domain-containing protein [Pholiota conissans]
MDSPDTNPNDNKPIELVCEACRNCLFSFIPFQKALASQRLLDGFSYSTTWEDVQRSASSECTWCALLLSIKDNTMPGHKVKVTVGFRMQSNSHHPGTMLKGRKTLRLGINGQPHSTFYTYTTTDDAAAPYIVARPLVRCVSSPESYRDAWKCIDHCISSHLNLCPKFKPSKLPTRVIDCTVPTKPKIFITNGTQDTYVALSYVWGESQPCTTTQNIASRIHALDFDALPKTIQDAITATHGYGLRYLWIDALCILQDSQADKDREIARMRRIYRDAQLTITAASARKVSEGFLHDRSGGQLVDDTRVPFLCPDRRVGSIWLSPVWKQYDETKEPVNGRGWCLQERMLSPRSLIYASHTVQYCCQTETVNIGDAVCSDISGKRLPNIVFGMGGVHVGSAPSKKEKDEARRSWQYILEDYSQRNITDPNDKLIAVSGLAAQFQTFFGSDYLAGLWRHTLLQDLLWFKDYQERLPRPEKYCAPSWSWAAINGRVITGMFDDYRLDSERYQLETCEIMDCSVVCANELETFGSVVGGVLQLRAPLVKAGWNPTAEIPDLFIFEDGLQVRVGHSYPDSKESEERARKEEEVWVVPMFWNPKEAFCVGLVVVAAIGEGRFCRVGYFHSSEDSKEVTWITQERLIVTIV